MFDVGSTIITLATFSDQIVPNRVDNAEPTHFMTVECYLALYFGSD